MAYEIFLFAAKAAAEIIPTPFPWAILIAALGALVTLGGILWRMGQMTGTITAELSSMRKDIAQNRTDITRDIEKSRTELNQVVTTASMEFKSHVATEVAPIKATLSAMDIGLKHLEEKTASNARDLQENAKKVDIVRDRLTRTEAQREIGEVVANAIHDVAASLRRKDS